MRDKADTYCGKCIKADVCGMEGVYDPATTYCAYKVEVRPHGEWIIRTDKNGMHIYSVCSNCNVAHLDTDFPNFCENCGSDNRKRGEDRANN